MRSRRQYNTAARKQRRREPHALCCEASAARLLAGPTLSVSHILGPQGTVLLLRAGDPDDVQDVMAIEARRRFQSPPAPPADIVVASNHPWPGDPMQSFKVLLQHRSACRPGGVLVGFFWTDPQELDRSVPLRPLRSLAASGRAGDWLVRRTVTVASSLLRAMNHPNAFMVWWARELVVDRTVLLYAPQLHNLLGPSLGPVRIFAGQDQLWEAAARALGSRAARASVRVFPAGGLTYCA